MDEKNIREITRFLKAGKPLPISYKDTLFPPDKKPKEYELVYDNKEREEDVLADTMAMPLQKVKTFGNNGDEGWTNKLIFGDNLQALKSLLKDSEVSGKVKCVYIDPPFATRGEFVGKKGERAYQDKIKGAKFIEFLRKRLILLRELLSPNGFIFVHLDNRMDSHMRLIMDEVFRNNFLNEIIWYYPDNFQGNVNRFADNHNIILFYSKTQNFRVEPVKIELPSLLKRDIRIWDKEKGKIVAARDKNGKIIYKEFKYKTADDVWIVGQSSVSKTKSSEYLGFPTQKPEELLRRIIEATTGVDDIVLDCFAGSGTALAVAEKLGRRWIGVDSSKFAIYAIQKRMLNLKKEIGEKGKQLKPRPFTLYNAGLYDYDLVSQLGEADYKKFALDLFQVEHRPLKIGGFHFEGTLYNCPAHVYLGKGKLTREYVYSLHKFVDGKIDRVFIIAPAGKVVPLEDYILCDNTKYYFLRIPYSIIDEIHKTSFARLIQPASVDEINDPLESTGFDFVIPPEVECDFYKIKNSETLVDEFVINMKRFEPIQISKKPIEFKDMEALSMVLVDRNYNGNFFNLTDYYFGDEIEKNDFKVKFSDENVGERIMIVYLDVLGNEKKEVKRRPDFKEKASKKKK